MLNFVTVTGERIGFVLLRALIPETGLEAMRHRRGKVSDARLSDGPGKLTQALGIDPKFHGKHLRDFATLTLPAIKLPIIADTRIGISKGKDIPWRFTLAQAEK